MKLKLSQVIHKGMPLLMLCFMLMSVVFVSADNQINLSVTYYYTNESQKAVVRQLFDDYQAKHPNIHLNVQVATLSKYLTNLQTRAVADDSPDVAMMSAQWVGDWADKGLLQEGNRYISGAVLKKFDSVRSLSDRLGSKIYGLPVTSTVRAMAYNADYFKKAGITPPTKLSEAWTWDQMIAAAKKAQAASGAKYAIQFEKASFDGWLPFLYEAGGQLLSNDLKKSAINSPQTRKALEWTLKLHKDGTAVPGIIDGTEDPLRSFASGLSTMWPTTNTSIEALEPQMKFKYGFTFMPRNKQQATVVGGTDWVVFKGKHPKEAWDLLLYLVSPEPMAIYSLANSSIPARSDVEVNWKQRPDLESFFKEQIKAMPKKLQIDQITATYAASRDKLLQELSAYVSGQQSIDSAISNMDQIINSNIKK